MLTEKDYCDYDTCVALAELGITYCGLNFYVIGDKRTLCNNILQYLTTRTAEALNYVLAIPLYVAQKFLREEKGIHISIDYDDFEWSYCLFDCSKKRFKQLSNCRMYFKSYEEVLLEGIKVSVEFLKEK